MTADIDIGRSAGRSSLRWKLILIILLVTSFGLAVMGAGLLINNHQFFKQSLLQDMAIMAEVLGNNSKAALAFGDDKEAAEILSALRADRHMIAGALYDAQGNLFARYWRPDLAATLPRVITSRDFADIDPQQATVLRSIRLNDDVIGRILLRSDTGQWTDILSNFMYVLGGLLLLTLTLVFGLSLRLQRLITAPIAHLAEIAKAVSLRRNYGLRARKFTNDEIGVLVDGFNDMLGEIQERHNELTHTQRELQERVRELGTEVRERSNAEAALRDSETRYRVLFENNPLPMWVYELDSQAFLAVNDAAIQHYGYTRDEFLSMTAADLSPFPDPGAPPGTGSGSKARGGGTAVRHKRKDGSIIDVEVVSHVIHFSGRRGEIVLANDVTERLRAEQSLQRYSERLSVLNQLDRIISASLNIHEIYETFVQGLGQLLRFDRTAVLVMDESREHLRLVDQWSDSEPGVEIGVHIPIADSVFGTLIRTRRPLVEREVGEAGDWPETAALRNEGIRSRVLLPLVVKNQVIGVLTIASRRPGAYAGDDLEVLMPLADQMAIALRNAQLYAQIQDNAAELERRVAERTAQLENANRELEAFSYSVSHDLRAPLRAMDGFSAALVTSYADKLDSQAHDYLQRIRAASQRMGRLIDDLLKLSRVTRSEISQTDVDLSKLAAEVFAELRSRYPERNVEIVVAPDLDVRADANLLTIVLENLLGNAWKFTAKQADARIEVGKQSFDGAAAYFVRDNGVGFDMAYANKLFGAFQRLHSDKDFEGTGIGLATVQRIVQRHGGRIWAESDLGQGATFYFTLS